MILFMSVWQKAVNPQNTKFGTMLQIDTLLQTAPATEFKKS